MSLKNNVYRLLVNLSKLPTDRLVTNEKVMRELNLNEDEFRLAKSELTSENLLDGGKTHLSLNEKGRRRIEVILANESNDINSTIFSDFEFTVIRFFYNRDGFVDIEDIPKVIKDSVPEKKGINDMPMVNYLHKQQRFFDHDFQKYKLNELGKSYYFHLLEQQKNKSINSSVSHHTTINAGNENIIAVGNQNSSFSINVRSGNIDSLKTELEKNKITQDDISEILQIVENEKLNDNKEFGPKTKSWLSKMLNKSLDGTWEISIATAGGILTEILNKYFGA